MLKSIVRWIVELIESFYQKQRSAISAKQIMATPFGVLLELSSEEPGVIAQYKIIDQRVSNDLLITMISVAQYREDAGRLYAYKRKTDPLPVSLSNFEDEFARFCETRKINRMFVTHIFCVAWKSKFLRSIGAKNSGGKYKRKYIVRPVVVLPCDLQGMRPLLGNRAALAITLAIAKKVMNLGTNDFDECISNQIDWHEWVRNGAKKTIGELHEI